MLLCHYFPKITVILTLSHKLFLLIFDSPCLTGYQHMVDSQEAVNSDLISPLPCFSCPFMESPQSSKCLKCAASFALAVPPLCLGSAHILPGAILPSLCRAPQPKRRKRLWPLGHPGSASFPLPHPSSQHRGCSSYSC